MISVRFNYDFYYLMICEVYEQKNSITNEWRNAVVIQIFNKCDKRDPQNYR